MIKNAIVPITPVPATLDRNVPDPITTFTDQFARRQRGWKWFALVVSLQCLFMLFALYWQRA